MPFGFGSKKEKEEKEKPEILYYAKYISGIQEFPEPRHARVSIFHDRIEVSPLHLTIPYSAISEMEQLDGGNKVSIDRLFALGFLTGPGALAALFWKKKHVYSIIHYNDKADHAKRCAIVLDFEDNFKYAHPLILDRMTKSRPLPNYTGGGIFSIKSDKPELVTSPEVAKTILSRGEEQNIQIVIFDARSGIKINGAKVSGMMVSPGGVSARLEEDVTDNNGQLSYKWTIPYNSELGIYAVTLDIIANGYRPLVTKTTFQVI